jgi:predicted aldo/keto reductase-like oxidoreductase
MENTLVKDCLKLGFGLMRLPRENGGKAPGAKIDVETTKKMVDAFLAAGGRYFDTAYIYEGSEEAIGEALCARYPRDAYYLASKLNVGAFAAGSEEKAKAQLATTLARTGAGYLDFYLLHSMDSENLETFDRYGIWEFAQEAKEKGLVRHVGFSFHDKAALLDEILTRHPEAEFVQLQLNYADWEDREVQSRLCYETAARHGKPVVVMEPVKGGLLADPPAAVREILTRADPDASPASWAIRFAASQENVMIVLSGMSNEAQMHDNLSYMKEFRPLSEAEQRVIVDAAEALRKIDQIPCTGCQYCAPGCPAGIHIPELFAVMNGYKIFGDLKRAKFDYGWRPGGAPASACVGCGQCEGACPQHLPIISLLEEIAATLE